MSADNPIWTHNTRLSVASFDQAGFDAACAELMRRIERDYAPTLIIGIRTGGYVVAQSMGRAASRRPDIMPLTCRRASTGVKSRVKLLRPLLSRLPTGASDTLRKLEHKLVTSRRKDHARPQRPDPAETAALQAHLATLDAPRILIADDAVDSGRTLAMVTEIVRGLAPASAELRTASITVTMDNPAIRPDYMLYSKVLCRFPWALDAA